MSKYLGYEQTGFANSSVTVTRAASGVTTPINHDSDPVSLYLPFDSDVQDTSANNHTVTSVASATISSTQAKFGGNSLSLNGTSQYLTIPDNNAFNFGGNDFTVEMWIYPTTIQQCGLYSQWGSGSNRSFKITMTGSGNVEVNGSRDGSTGSHLSITSSSTLSVNNWYHIAAVCVDGSVTLYIDGVDEGNDGIGGNLYNSTNNVAIGANIAGVASNLFAGYIDDVRVIKNVARYAKSFVPPSQAVGATLDGTNETNTTTDFTSLYLPFDSDVNDDSSHSHSVTASGDAAISSTQVKFGSNSLAVDGNGDFLSIPDSDTFNFQNGDFTVECFIRPDSINTSGMTSAVATFVDHDSNAGTTGAWFSFSQQNATLLWSVNNGTLITTSSCLSAATWHHVAAVRAGDTTTIYCDGVNVGSASDTQDYDDSTSRVLYIGKQNSNTRLFTGYIDDLRILKGYAKYTADFVTPTSAVGTSVSETVNDLSVLYMPFDAVANTTTTTTSSSDTKVRLNFEQDPVTDQGPGSVSLSGSTSSLNTTYKKFGSSSFDGNSNYISFNRSIFDVNADNWTVEAWTYQSSAVGGSANPDFVWQSWGSGNTRDFYAAIGAGNKIMFGYYNNDTSSFTYVYGTSALPTGQFNHLAWVKHNGDLKLYANGVQEGATTALGTVRSNATSLQISHTGTFSFVGYIDDFRMIQDNSLYTGTTYTEPTSTLTNTADIITTTLSGGFEDQARNHYVTKSGTAQLSAGVKKYGASSLLLDGDSDYLTIPNSGDFQFDNGDFTIEAWVYQTSAAGTDAADRHPIVSRMDGSSNRSFHFGIAESSGAQKLQFSFTTNGSSSTQYTFGGDVTINNWHHVALVRQGSTVTCFLNGTALGTTGNIGSSSIYVGTSDLTIGFRGLSSQYFTGYIDDLRIIKGHAKYTENFTAPTSAHGHVSIEETSTTSETYSDTKFLSGVWSLNDAESKMQDGEWIRNDSDTGSIPSGVVIKGAGLEVEGHRWYQTPAGPGLPSEDDLQYIVVGGGGGGGANIGGGGGAGGYRVFGPEPLSPGTYPVVVGSGASAMTGNNTPPGAPRDSRAGGQPLGGQNSSFNSKTAIGGGTAGGNWDGNPNGGAGAHGGSGGGAGGNSSPSAPGTHRSAGNGNTPSQPGGTASGAEPNQGNPGGLFNSGPGDAQAGGGGGATQAGGEGGGPGPSPGYPGDGGDGKQWPVTGKYYAGGGGGGHGKSTPYQPEGGLGGGGKGLTDNFTTQSDANATYYGGGGGGSRNGGPSGGPGFPGVVKIAYPGSSQAPNITGGTVQVNANTGYVIHVFTSPGNFVIS